MRRRSGAETRGAAPAGVGVQGWGLRVEGAGFRVQGSGFRRRDGCDDGREQKPAQQRLRESSGFKVQGSGLRVEG